jgi:hypothetical protein
MGIMSIARGTVPLALFGAPGYAVLMGRLATPSSLAQAISPLLGALVLESGGPTDRPMTTHFAPLWTHL